MAITEKKESLWGPVFSAIILTAGMLIVVQIMTKRPMLMVDRYFPGMGWIEIVALSLYSGFLIPKLLNPRTSIRWRSRTT